MTQNTPSVGDVNPSEEGRHLANVRFRLPDTCKSITHHFNVVGHNGVITVALYSDGKPGGLFVKLFDDKEGSTISGLVSALCTTTTLALQYGVPIDSLVDKLTHLRFEPSGMTTNNEIPFVKSLVDYIFRWMGMQFIPGYKERNSPKTPGVVSDEKN